MPIPQPTEISLRVTSETSFLALAVAFAGNAGKAYGFGDREIHVLELGAEEIFTWLCRVLGPAEPVEIRAGNGIYRLTLRFLFKPSPLNLRVLNLTAKAPIESGEGLEDLGLFVVARLVDALKLTRESDGRTGLSVIVERRYAQETIAFSGGIQTARSWRIEPADRDAVQFLAALVKAHYLPANYPGFLNYAGQAADMITAGDLRAAVAVAESGAACGGILWRWISEKMIEMLGPFLFPPTQPLAIAQALTEHLVEWTAKTPAVGILCQGQASQPIPAQFDLLGTTLGQSAGQPAGDQVYGFRQLREDEGSAVCCHPALEAFLRREYDRLALPRALRVIPCQGTGAPEPAVLTCETDRARGQVVLRGLRFGQDAVANLREHLARLAGRNVPTILFELDLGVAWQSAFAPALLEAGFVPRMIVPWAGEADTVIFQQA